MSGGMWQWLPRRLRGEARDLIELVLVPGLAAVLPWRWCFVLFRSLARASAPAPADGVASKRLTA